jgi:hypothetical protein
LGECPVAPIFKVGPSHHPTCFANASCLLSDPIAYDWPCFRKGAADRRTTKFAAETAAFHRGERHARRPSGKIDLIGCLTCPALDPVNSSGKRDAGFSACPFCFASDTFRRGASVDTGSSQTSLNSSVRCHRSRRSAMGPSVLAFDATFTTVH